MKNLRKLMSIILVVLMVSAMAVPSFAANEKKAACPEIYIPGFVSSVIYADKDDPSTKLGLPDKDTLISILTGEIIPAFIAYAADNNADKLGHSISGVINTLFEAWFNNPDGSAVGNAGARFVYPSAESVKKADRLRFSYDWRGDPIEIASQLNDYINYVLEATGSDKVALSSHSFGAAVVLTYFSLYGTDKVMGVVFDTPALNGLTSVGELFSGRTDFDAQGVATLLKMIMGTTEYDELLSSIVDIFTLAGINGSISDFLDNAYDKIGDILMKETLFPLFGSWLSIWAMIPDEYIDEVMAYSFDSGVYDGDYGALKAKICEYNEKVRKNKIDTILDFDKEGRVAVISRYGYSGVPMTNQWTMIGDAVIETENSSFGATTAAFGEVLSDEYLANKDMKYISPDKTLDASTCLFPDRTWFVKNAMHEDAEITIQLYKQLLLGEEEATCDNSEISRFMLYDRENGALVTDESQPIKTEKLTVFDIIFNFIKALINKLLDLFRK